MTDSHKQMDMIGNNIKVLQFALVFGTHLWDFMEKCRRWVCPGNVKSYDSPYWSNMVHSLWETQMVSVYTHGSTHGNLAAGESKHVSMDLTGLDTYCAHLGRSGYVTCLQT